MAGVLLITAPSADTKAMNRAIVHLHSYPGYFPSLKLVLSDQLEDLKTLGFSEGAESPFTKPDIRPPTSNAWAGASLSTIETNALDRTLYLVIDDEGLQDQTRIVAERITSFEEKPSGECEAHRSGVHGYDRVRMPWSRATSMFNNLAIANIGFEDFIEDSNGANFNSPTVDGQGRWWTADDEEPDMTAEEEQKEAEELARLEKEGLI
ncbi:GroES-like protein [Apiospora saccharicola]|uniref:GroES-like protein n=1 Tax=Apiospora saccharicola TaxID=335842 RepID=A0ABR1WFQ4_9PEZI